MHNDTEDKMQRGWRGLKLGARIVIMLSLVVCCIALLLLGVLLFIVVAMGNLRIALLR